MLIASLLILALLGGVHPAAIALGATMAYQPVIAGIGLVVWGVWHAVERRRKRPTAVDDAAYLRAVAAEMGAGSSPRTAVVSAAAGSPRLDLDRVVRLARAGADVGAVGEAVREAMVVDGRLAGAAFRLSSRSGARASAVFEDLAATASERAELARERRASTAQARMSAGVVGVVPLLLSFLLLVTGTGPGAEGAGRPFVAAGLVLELAGLGVIGLMLWNGER